MMQAKIERKRNNQKYSGVGTERWACPAAVVAYFKIFPKIGSFPNQVSSPGYGFLSASQAIAPAMALASTLRLAATLLGFACWKRKQARNNSGVKFTELSHRLEPGRRDAAVVEEHRRRVGVEDRVASRLRVPAAARAEYVSTTAKKGAHVLVEGSLVSTTYERGNGILTRQGYYIGLVR